MANIKENIKWEELQGWMNDHPQFLIMVADPSTDEIAVSFNKLNTFVRFPPGPKENGIIFNALRTSRFKDAIDPLICGIVKGTGISEKKEGGELLKVLGGSIRALGHKVKSRLPEKAK